MTQSSAPERLRTLPRAGDQPVDAPVHRSVPRQIPDRQKPDAQARPRLVSVARGVLWSPSPRHAQALAVSSLMQPQQGAPRDQILEHDRCGRK